MNKSQLVEAVAAKADLKKKDADAAVAAVFEAIT
ncbi:MAG: HU family DNA-binding protein, partial [Clostridia bacterium]|nr:HU family DNA-binding protein [Clostridia bacterium]